MLKLKLELKPGLAATVLATALFMASLSPAWANARLALVIGNGEYGNQPLSNPANDASLMAQTLRDVGFEVMEVINADRRALRRAVHDYSKLLNQSGEDAVGFVYYAGHGIQAQGENYMIPVDARIEDSIDVEFEGFPASTLLNALGNAGNRLNIVVMDACRNNPYKAATRSGGTGLARMDAPSGTLIAYSTAPGKVAADGRGKNSPYTRALARAIQTPGAKVEDVFKSVRIAVMDRTNDAQVPWESSSLTGDFFFVDEAPQPAPVAAPAAPAQPDNTVELTFWNSIKDSDDPGLFEAYLSQYPNGLFAALASAKIAAIQKRNAAALGQTDTAFFQAIQNSEDAADFEAYLEQYPNGAFAALARARIASIDRRSQQVSRSAAQSPAAAPQTDPDTDFWNQVKDARTVAELQAYLGRFPQGKYADIAKAKIAGIEEQRQVAALAPGHSGHPMDGKWRLRWENVRQGTWPNAPFCRRGETAELVVNVENGKFDTRVNSNFGGGGNVRATLSENGTVRGFFTGLGWSSGTKSFSLTLKDGTGSGRADRCGTQEFTLTRLAR